MLFSPSTKSKISANTNTDTTWIIQGHFFEPQSDTYKP